MGITPEFWRGRRVLLTGHTGFKGAWLAQWLVDLGAEVHALALAPETAPNLFDALGLAGRVRSKVGDIRDLALVTEFVVGADPEIALHLAAQALVRRSYREPVETFASNAQGTVHVLEALRRASRLRAALVVTSDKVYANPGTGHPLRETDRLGGADPYAASKAMAEIATQSYARAYFDGSGIPIATARAGNVIGGGDWAEDRIIPDIWRATRQKAKVTLRYPDATRPWQHVLEPLAGYLIYLETLVRSPEGLPRALNFGPAGQSAITVAELVARFQAEYGHTHGWERSPGSHPPEAPYLSIDATLAQQRLPWGPMLRPDEAVAWTAAWYRAWDRGESAEQLTHDQIRRFQARMS